MSIKTIFLLLIVLCAAGLNVSSAFAEARESRPIKIDSRVHTIMYQPDAVFKFTGHYGFQSVIEFGEGEEITTISMGDATGWMMNPLGNRLFIKPVEQDATTNMTLITNRRTYLFELHAREALTIADEDMVFVMRFIYPGQDDTSVISQFTDAVPINDAIENPNDYNFAYTISGPEALSPLRIFDDGEFTYFEFKDVNADLPAFFAVEPDGSEAIINYRMRGNFIVVERVEDNFTLRYGKQVVCVFNEGFQKSKALAIKDQLQGNE